MFVKWRGWSSGLPGQDISHFLPRKIPTHPLPLCQFGGPAPGDVKVSGDCSGKSKTKGMIHLFSCTRSLPKAGATQGQVLTSQRCVRGKQAQPFPSTFPALKRGVDAFQPQSGRRMVPTSQLFFLRLEGSYQSKLTLHECLR